jgi:glycosyltransferase involved in cell wall biosynthesis
MRADTITNFLAFDDASTDDTLARLYEAAPRFPRLQIVPLHRNGGSGTVRRIGTQRAHGEIVVWTDADMTYPNERIPEAGRRLVVATVTTRRGR